MAIVNAYLAWEASTTEGTGAYTLDGVAFDADRTTFANVISDQDQVVYIAVEDGDNFEVNIGTWTAAGNTLSRDVLLFSTTGAAQNWGPGTRQVRAIQEPVSTAGFLLAANNLSDVANAATARSNLGLGTMAVESASDFVDKRVNDQSIDGTILRIDGSGGPNRFQAEDPAGPHAWYGFRISPDTGVIAHNDGTNEKDVITFDQSSLAFASGLSITGLNGAFAAARVELSANQTARIAAGNHIEFDTIADITPNSGISLSTGAGQNSGVLEIPAGVWALALMVRILGPDNTSGQLNSKVFDADGLVDLSTILAARVSNVVSAASPMGSAFGMLDSVGAAGTTSVEARITSVIDVDAIVTNETSMMVFGLKE